MAIKEQIELFAQRARCVNSAAIATMRVLANYKVTIDQVIIA